VLALGTSLAPFANRPAVQRAGHRYGPAREGPATEDIRLPASSRSFGTD
jgi:hypothetical protein